MNLKIIIVIVVAAVLWFVVFLIKPTPIVFARGYEPPVTPSEALMIYSKTFGASYRELYLVMKCESGGNIEAVGDHGHAYGILQFHRDTFGRWSKQMGEELDYNSFADQAKLGAWAFSQGYQNAWTCYTKLYGRHK